MAIELKIRHNDLASVEEILQRRQATLRNTSNSIHHYIDNQPDGTVLKLVREGDTAQKIGYKKHDGCFVISFRDVVSDYDNELSLLQSRFGVRKVLSMQSKTYQIGEYSLGLYHIDDIGNFVILEGDNPTLELLAKFTDIRKPEIITVPFDRL